MSKLRSLLTALTRCFAAVTEIIDVHDDHADSVAHESTPMAG